MRHASVPNPVTASTNSVPRPQQVVALGLDADAVRPLDVAPDERPRHADQQTEAGHVADQRVALVGRAVQELRALGQQVVDLEDGGDGQQDEEAEVDQRVHEPGGRIAQQGLHVHAGADSRRAVACAFFEPWSPGGPVRPVPSS